MADLANICSTSKSRIAAAGPSVGRLETLCGVGGNAPENCNLYPCFTTFKIHCPVDTIFQFEIHLEIRPAMGENVAAKASDNDNPALDIIEMDSKENKPKTHDRLKQGGVTYTVASLGMTYPSDKPAI